MAKDREFYKKIGATGGNATKEKYGNIYYYLIAKRRWKKKKHTPIISG